jgi:serine protease Do
VTLDGVRYGEKRTWKVRLTEAPADEKTVAAAPTKAKDDNELGSSVTATKLGITVQPLTPALLQANRIKEDVSGVLVKEIENGGPSAAKLAPGDIITGVIFPDKSAVKSPADLQRALGKVKEGDIIGLKLSRLTSAQGDRQTAAVNIRVGGQ